MAACLVCEAPALVALDGDRRRCRRCGFVVGPRTDASAVAYARLYAGERGREVEEGRRRHYLQLLASLPPFGNRRTLDVGCGGGLFSRLAAAAGWTAVGVDPAVIEEERDGFRLVRRDFPASAATLGGPFALVTFHGSLNYMDDPVAALRAAHGVLEPGGRVFVRVPNVSVHLVVRRAARALAGNGRLVGWLAGAPIVHARAFSARALAVALERAGFVDVVVDVSRPVPGDPYGSGVAAIGAAKRLVGALGGALARVSRRRVLWSPSLEARAVRAR
jgi:SAM-dependent methyltransferase